MDPVTKNMCSNKCQKKTLPTPPKFPTQTIRSLINVYLIFVETNI